MGSFYTNITLRGPSPEQVADYLNEIDRTTFVSPTTNNITIVYDLDSEEQATDILSEFASELSKQFQGTALAVLNHDDDLLWFQLYQGGNLIDDYNSTPDMFDDEAEQVPTGGDAGKLCAAFGVEDVVDQVETILRKPSGSDGYLFANERHRELAKALGMPADLVSVGYNYLAHRDVGLRIDLSKFDATGDATLGD